MTTITLTAQQQQALQAECNAYNAAQPEGTTALTLDQFVQLVTAARADSMVRQYGAVPAADFVLRFTGAESDAIKAAAATDANVAALFAQLANPDEGKVHLWKSSVIGGLAYLVGKGLLTQARADAIGAITFGA